MKQHGQGYRRLCGALGVVLFGALIINLSASAHNQRVQTKSVRVSATGAAVVIGPDLVWSQTYSGTAAPTVATLAFAPDGQTILTGHRDRSVNVWRASDGALVRAFPHFGYTCGGITSVGYTPDSQLLIAADPCSTRLLSLADGTLVRTISAAGHVAISPDGQYFASTIAPTYRTRFVKLWRFDGSLIWSVPGGGNEVAFAPDGTVATTGNGGIEFWQLSDGAKLRTISGPNNALAFSADGQFVAGAGAAGGEYPYDSTIEWYRLSDGTLVRQLTRTGVVGALRFTPDGQYLVGSGYDTNFDRTNGYTPDINTLRIWRLADGLAFKTYDLGTDYPGLAGLALAPDGQSFAYGINATTYLAHFPAPTGCTYSITPTSATFERDGGTGNVAIDTQPGCPSTARDRVNWITITSNRSGTGPGAVTYNVLPDTDSVAPGPPYYIHDVLIVAEQTFAVHQNIAPPCPCYYKIYGQVTDNFCGSGIAGVTVTLGGASNATVLTDQYGFFSFDHLLGGQNYTVAPSKDGYTFSPSNRTIDNLSYDNGLLFTTTVNPNPPPSIRGRIADASGHNIAGIELQLDGGTYSRTGYTYDSYAFNCLDPGFNYTLTPSSALYTFTPASRTFNNLTTAQTGDFTATPNPITISGHVTVSGQPLAGTLVTLYNDGQPTTTTTDNTGFYTFTTGAPGYHDIIPSKDGYTFTPQYVSFHDPVGNRTADFTATPSATVSGQVLISEFRPRGPAGAQDEFVELYNNSDQPLTVSTTDGSAGWSLATLDENGTAPVLLVAIPNGTTMPARGHYLLANNNSGGYSLSVAPDQTFAADIGDNNGLALFRTAQLDHMTMAYRFDAVGFAGMQGSAAPLFYAGAGLAVANTNVGADEQYSYVRKQTTGTPQNTGDNAQDFALVSTTGTVAGSAAQLGAPEPENSASPVQRNAQIKTSLVDPQAGSSAAPNRARDATPNICGNSNCALGTLTIRRKFTNKTGQTVTALRFRIVDITTLNTPNSGGQADLRALNSVDVVVLASSGASVPIKGTTLEPPDQSFGGGLNSALAVALPAPLGANASVNVQFVLGVQAGGSYRFLVNIEAVTNSTNTAQKLGQPTK